jgi:hypothetical protein
MLRKYYPCYQTEKNAQHICKEYPGSDLCKESRKKFIKCMERQSFLKYSSVYLPDDCCKNDRFRDASLKYNKNE